LRQVGGFLRYSDSSTNKTDRHDITTGEFEADLKINATWDPKYEDKNSTEYKDLTERFRNQV
jgi:hypothetical protein